MTTPTPRLVRPHVLELESVVHGSVPAAELAPFGLRPADVVDFSVNTNPLGPASAVLHALESTDWTRYPGDDEAPLRRGLAEQAGVRPEQVALGNGSAELLWLIALAVLRSDDRVAILGPTFGEYQRAARVAGAEVIDVRTLTEVPAARVVFACNPNNPTATLLSRAEVERLLLDQPDRLVLLDEAYASFVGEHRWRSEPLLTEHSNLVILRSLTKDHALPGLRLGYLLASTELARAIEAVRPPWSVNAGALRAGLATLEPAAVAHVERAQRLVATSREILSAGFSRLGFSVEPSAANFVLVQVGDSTAFRRTLLPHGLVVRDCTSFGLPDHIRVACRLPEECRRLLEVVEQLRVREPGRQIPDYSQPTIAQSVEQQR
jgi:histidinol-phosphate aminotransferase